MHEVLVNRLGGLSLPRKSVVRLTDRPDMTLDVYRGRKTTIQQQQQPSDVALNMRLTLVFRNRSVGNLEILQMGQIISHCNYYNILIMELFGLNLFYLYKHKYI